jgi:hypothetical protein
LRRFCSALAPYWTTAEREQRADGHLDNCSMIYEQSAARIVREQQEKRSCGGSRQPLKIEQLRRSALRKRSSLPIRASSATKSPSHWRPGRRYGLDFNKPLRALSLPRRHGITGTCSSADRLRNGRRFGRRGHISQRIQDCLWNGTERSGSDVFDEMVARISVAQCYLLSNTY